MRKPLLLAALGAMLASAALAQEPIRIGAINPYSGPVALYGVVLLFSSIAYFILARLLVSLHGSDSVIAIALGRDFKGKVSTLIYLVAIPLAFFKSRLACAFYVLVAVTWLVPDRRIEKTIVQP